ncbi:hypothetical protein BRE01_38690 [Brevibacillus reuszeri]|uniref:Uncharacterized protein n=1 Tax=Brevibacillus reuszeri TaxID=54915 RepID=A0ABQ0TRX1_9BACL|nr:hypothetical protein [Brevibacillus reuszeri]MED1860498.1 hypothetical protein [Brevibacillus reuszeri]GED70167.1 hypothetical protein BRE01_38690 [Brevibacillus reuszeri]
MWTCPYCGGNHGLPFHDEHLDGMLCLGADCGRFVEESVIQEDSREWDYMDL